MTTSYDTSNATNEKVEYELIPEGKYNVTIESAVIGETSTGKPNVKITYNPEGVEGKLFDQPLLEYIKNTLDFFKAESIDDLVGKKGEIRCYHQEYKDKKYSKVAIPRPLIKSGTIVRVCMTIVPGGLGVGGMETKSATNENNRYLKTLLTILEGENSGVKLFLNIMCASNDNKTMNFGLYTMKAINRSGNLGLDESSITPQGLDGSIFYVEVGVQTDKYGTKNYVKKIVEDAPDEQTDENSFVDDIDDDLPF